MPGDPHTPPLCPNAAQHSRMAQRYPPPPPNVLYPPHPLPGSPPQRLFAPTSRRQRFFRNTFDQRHIRFLKLLGRMFVIGLVVVSLGYIVRVASLIPGFFSRPGTSTAVVGPLITDATLGGIRDAFQAKFGSPSGTGPAGFYTFPQGRVVVVFSDSPSSDGKNHVISLRIGPASGQWNEASAIPICAEFLPNDARFVREQQVKGLGPERVYTSANLAATLPVSTFNGLPPGTLAMQLGPGFPSNQGCLLIAGE